MCLGDTRYAQEETSVLKSLPQVPLIGTNSWDSGVMGAGLLVISRAGGSVTEWGRGSQQSPRSLSGRTEATYLFSLGPLHLPHKRIANMPYRWAT